MFIKIYLIARDIVLIHVHVPKYWNWYPYHCVTRTHIHGLTQPELLPIQMYAYWQKSQLRLLPVTWRLFI